MENPKPPSHSPWRLIVALTIIVAVCLGVVSVELYLTNYNLIIAGINILILLTIHMLFTRSWKIVMIGVVYVPYATSLWLIMVGRPEYLAGLNAVSLFVTLTMFTLPKHALYGGMALLYYLRRRATKSSNNDEVE